jgi:hypothetical protein
MGDSMNKYLGHQSFTHQLRQKSKWISIKKNAGQLEKAFQMEYLCGLTCIFF